MDKVKIDNNAFVYPLPMVLAGAMKLGYDGFGVWGRTKATN